MNDMVSAEVLIIAVGGLIAVVGGVARLFWKAILVIGLLVLGFGFLNLVFQWVK